MQSALDSETTSYVIVISENTLKTWPNVVKALENKHKAKIVVYQSALEESLPQLKEFLPYYTCFVASPDECGKDFVSKVSHLTTSLLSGPFTDTIWGILTGPDQETAEAIATHTEPLKIKNVLAACPIPLGKCPEGEIFSEITKNESFIKQRESLEISKVECAGDITEGLVERLNCRIKDIAPVDLMITSGHATERDWNIGFGYKGGRFIHEGNSLLGEDVEKKRFPIESKNPKVYIAAGNCLMGHIDCPEKGCMALAWMKSAAVIQMIGYTVPTWFGYGGWGVLKYFLQTAGRFNLAQAFYANLQTLVNLRENDSDKNNVEGYSHDFDVVAFYGDPAWDARISEDGLTLPKAYDIEYKEDIEKKQHHLYVKTQAQGSWTCKNADDKNTDPGRPPFFIFPRRLHNPVVLSGKAIVTSLFVMFNLEGGFEKGVEEEVTILEVY